MRIPHVSRLERWLRRLAPCCAFGACSLPTPPQGQIATETHGSALSVFRSAAFVIDVNAVRLSAQVSPPTGSPVRATPLAVPSSTPAAGMAYSLLGADAIDIAVSNVVRGPIGASVLGKVLLTFDLRLINRLPGVSLSTATFPTPPTGMPGVHAFPFEVSVITSTGGVGTRRNEIMVTAPNFGAIIASPDWDGSPHSFFNDASCDANANDCFRFEPFGTIAPLGVSASRRVGFLIDPTVGDIRVKVLVAADLVAAP